MMDELNRDERRRLFADARSLADNCPPALQRALAKRIELDITGDGFDPSAGELLDPSLVQEMPSLDGQR